MSAPIESLDCDIEGEDFRLPSPSEPGLAWEKKTLIPQLDGPAAVARLYNEIMALGGSRACHLLLIGVWGAVGRVAGGGAPRSKHGRLAAAVNAEGRST